MQGGSRESISYGSCVLLQLCTGVLGQADDLGLKGQHMVLLPERLTAAADLQPEAYWENSNWPNVETAIPNKAPRPWTD